MLENFLFFRKTHDFILKFYIFSILLFQIHVKCVDKNSVDEYGSSHVSFLFDNKHQHALEPYTSTEEQTLNTTNNELVRAALKLDVE
jgi:hypothetical protein